MIHPAVVISSLLASGDIAFKAFLAYHLRGYELDTCGLSEDDDNNNKDQTYNKVEQPCLPATSGDKTNLLTLHSKCLMYNCDVTIACGMDTVESGKVYLGGGVSL